MLAFNYEPTEIEKNPIGLVWISRVFHSGIRTNEVRNNPSFSAKQNTTSIRK